MVNARVRILCVVLTLLILEVLFLFFRDVNVRSTYMFFGKQRFCSDKYDNKHNTPQSKTKKLVMTQKPFSSVYVNRHLRYNQSYISRSSTGHHDILWWNEPNWMKSSKWNEFCNTSLCEYSNCKVTTDKKQVNRSSAVIISIIDDGAKHVPVSRSDRNKNQSWVFFTLESPMSVWNRAFDKEEWQNVFNWSMTYHRDANIFLPYGWLGQQHVPTNKDYTDIFRKKTKQVAWIVSHCQTSGKREEYVKQLQKYIDVDIYGRCGDKLTDDELYNTLSDYKFYLGFENALCQDYITEKFFHYFKYDLIVIVRGLTDYGKHLPNNTFINTADFSSIKAIGKYLSKLANNENEYINYLKAKDRFAVLERDDMYCDGLCNICEKVNNINANRHVYGNIFKWIGACNKPNDTH